MFPIPFIFLPFIIQSNFSKRGFIDYCALPKKIEHKTPSLKLQNFINDFNQHEYHFRLTFDHSVSFFDTTYKPFESFNLETLNFAHAILNFKPHFLDVKKNNPRILR